VLEHRQYTPEAATSEGCGLGHDGLGVPGVLRLAGPPLVREFSRRLEAAAMAPAAHENAQRHRDNFLV
jgi:hypothetical protein